MTSYIFYVKGITEFIRTNIWYVFFEGGYVSYQDYNLKIM